MSLYDDVAAFRRRVRERDEVLDLRQQLNNATTRVPTTVTYGDMVTESSGFQPVPKRALRILSDNGDSSACHCTLDELWLIWRANDSASVIEEYRQFPSPIGPGRIRVKGCIRFAKVDGRQITELNGSISATARRALLSLGLGGCFAVEFFGTQKIHGGGLGGDGARGRDFQGSTEDFIIFKLICNH